METIKMTDRTGANGSTPTTLYMTREGSSRPVSLSGASTATDPRQAFTHSDAEAADQATTTAPTTHTPSGTINVSLLVTNRKLSDGMIAPAEESVEYELAGEHTAEPIKSLDDIRRISQYLISQGRYRDNMLFICGINFGLRVSDLLTLRFCSLINTDLSFKDEFPILEKKTKNTRKVRKNRWLSINDAVVEAVTLYLANVPSKLDDYMFRSESNNGSLENKPLSRKSVDRILKSIQSDLNIQAHMSSHSLRKTFGYHQMAMANNDPRKLLLLQRMFGHSSVAQTMTYIGITDEEIQNAYLELNLGGRNQYTPGAYRGFSQIHEAV